MGKKAAKSTRKFAASGQLKKTIEARRKHRDIKKKAEKRQAAKGKGRQVVEDEDEGVSGDENEGAKTASGKPRVNSERSRFKGMSVDDFLGGGFMQGASDDEDEGVKDEDAGSEEEDVDDNESFADVDDLEDEGEAHLMELSKLAEKDPEFFKYLQENDRELLEFSLNDAAVGDDEDMEGEGSAQEDRTPVLTKEILQKWQKALLDHRSLKALRKMLIAFRSAVHMNEEDQVLAWRIDSSSVYSKLVTTALRYTPVVLEHHCPSRSLPNGKFKPPTQTNKWKTLQKLILSYFHNVLHLMGQISDNEMLRLALSETAKLVPYITSNRKTVKLYLKTCLDYWSSAEDSVRISAFLSVRRLAAATDESIVDTVLKNTYLTLVRSCKSTSAHTLPSINLMKNSASELFCADHAASYQHAFGYIRQLAIHLRNSMKTKTKEAYKLVYNWQYVHCVDFWAIVIARACSKETLLERGGKESELKELIYPLVQVALGAARLIRNARSFPFHLHIVRSMLHLTRHTHTYVPLAPYLLPILTSTLSASSKPKASTLRPLDFETAIRAPQQYLKTRVYNEGLAEESAFLLAEYLASPPVHGSIGFPEVTVPIVLLLRKAVKGAKGAQGKGGKGKETGVVKALVERVEESARWVEEKRKGVAFAPGKMAEVERWEEGVGAKAEDTPLGKYVKVQRKAREKRKKLVEKAREGEDEILED
ncbi:Noc2-domain-containing protein [Lentinus tigrinus ALCF2SS1-7]|uniref:Noc2-domain-containing protein n=1 Tax=Lentinus tigrinus ALCF2SS1-7 TaxID=1328758 RepID=UPI0011663C76|nr:Noc2-domain-containing protein [Lentinus tigrinus ALCF2SS1-7]